MTYDVLVVDDQKDICDLIADVLKEEGYRPHILTEGHRVLEFIRTHNPHLVIMDIWLNDSRFDGIELLDILKQDFPHLPVVMISGHGNIETAVSALKKGAYDFIEKPFQEDRLLAVVARGIEVSNLRKQVQSLKKDPSSVVLYGQSPAMNLIRQSIDKVAKTNSRIMIEGPSGVGKEVVARFIHQNSLRAANPFVVFNCAAVSPEKIEEELFGVEKGTDTPNVSIKMGVLEQADQGTLFLDCVADLPLAVQGKLVNILQNNRFCRVGGTRSLTVDVRIMSSTLGNIHDLIQKGKFREDLYYRLNVVPISIPPLSERVDDISDLTCRFLKEVSGQSYEIGEPAKRTLEGYAWPGNVRQLKNMVEWILIMHPNTNNLIDKSMLPPEILNDEQQVTSALSDTAFYELPLRDAREEFERRYLSFHIKRFGGNITKTASAIQMERTALHRKIKLLQLLEEEGSESLSTQEKAPAT
jgi:two-component system nitrogen regulation response regulator NtrX